MTINLTNRPIHSIVAAHSFGVLRTSKSVVKLYDSSTLVAFMSHQIDETSLCNSDSGRIVGIKERVVFA